MPGDHQTAYAAHSPTQTPFPPERARSSNPSTPAPLPGHPSYTQPTSPSTQGALPPIASALYPRDPPSTSKYYDPTSDQAPPAAGRSDPRYNGHYPAQVCHCISGDDAGAKLEEMQVSLTEWMPGSRALQLRRLATIRRPISLTSSRIIPSTAGPPATSILAPGLSSRPPSSLPILAEALPRPQPKHNVRAACCHT